MSDVAGNVVTDRHTHTHIHTNYRNPLAHVCRGLITQPLHNTITHNNLPTQLHTVDYIFRGAALLYSMIQVHVLHMTLTKYVVGSQEQNHAYRSPHTISNDKDNKPYHYQSKFHSCHFYWCRYCRWFCSY